MRWYHWLAATLGTGGMIWLGIIFKDMLSGAAQTIGGWVVDRFKKKDPPKSNGYARKVEVDEVKGMIQNCVNKSDCFNRHTELKQDIKDMMDSHVSVVQGMIQNNSSLLSTQIASQLGSFQKSMTDANEVVLSAVLTMKKESRRESRRESRHAAHREENYHEGT